MCQKLFNADQCIKIWYFGTSLSKIIFFMSLKVYKILNPRGHAELRADHDIDKWRIVISDFSATAHFCILHIVVVLGVRSSM